MQVEYTGILADRRFLHRSLCDPRCVLPDFSRHRSVQKRLPHTAIPFPCPSTEPRQDLSPMTCREHLRQTPDLAAMHGARNGIPGIMRSSGSLRVSRVHSLSTGFSLNNSLYSYSPPPLRRLTTSAILGSSNSSFHL